MFHPCPKDVNWRSEEYLEYIRGFACMGCQVDGCSIAHHVRLGTDGGTSLKPSDFWAVPLCSTCHRRLHDKGEATFQEGCALNLKTLACILATNSGLVPVHYQRSLRAEERL